MRKTLLTISLLLSLIGNSYADVDSAIDSINLKGVDIDAVMDELKLYAKDGDAKAQWALSTLYHHGITKEGKRPELSAKWAKKSAGQGHTMGQHFLGLLYKKGDGVSKDHKKAVYWLLKSAKQNNGAAQYSLADMYCKGLGVEANNKLAKKWYMKSGQSDSNFKDSARQAISNMDRECYGEAGPSDAIEQYNLAYEYATGKGRPQNYKRAYKWFFKSATQGYAGSENWIGVLFNNGDGVKQDEELANYWFERSANNGDAYGQYNIGIRYFWGTGIDRDYEKAANYLKKSAAQDNIEAQIKLGEMYENGQGVLKNYKAAAKLYKKASEKDSAEAYIKIANLMLLALNEEVIVPEDAEDRRRYHKTIAKAVNKAFDLSNEGSEIHSTAKKMWSEYELWKYPY